MTDFQQTANSEVVASYTLEQLRAHDSQIKVGEYQRGYTDGQGVEKARLHDSWAEVIKGIFKSQVADGNLDRDYALELYNEIISNMGLAPISTLGATYLVSVEVFGNTVLEHEIEADSEEEAEDYARNNLTIEELSVVFRLDIDGDSAEGELSTYDYDFGDIILNNTEYTVTEQ